MIFLFKSYTMTAWRQQNLNQNGLYSTKSFCVEALEETWFSQWGSWTTISHLGSRFSAATSALKAAALDGLQDCREAQFAPVILGTTDSTILSLAARSGKSSSKSDWTGGWSWEVGVWCLHFKLHTGTTRLNFTSAVFYSTPMFQIEK